MGAGALGNSVFYTKKLFFVIAIKFQIGFHAYKCFFLSLEFFRLSSIVSFLLHSCQFPLHSIQICARKRSIPFISYPFPAHYHGTQRFTLPAAPASSSLAKIFKILLHPCEQYANISINMLMIWHADKLVCVCVCVWVSVCLCSSKM